MARFIARNRPRVERKPAARAARSVRRRPDRRARGLTGSDRRGRPHRGAGPRARQRRAQRSLQRIGADEALHQANRGRRWPHRSSRSSLRCVLRNRPAAAVSGEPYELNAILSLTGPAAFYGHAEQQAMSMIEAITNKSGGIRGRPLKITVVDDQSNPQYALQTRQFDHCEEGSDLYRLRLHRAVRGDHAARRAERPDTVLHVTGDQSAGGQLYVFRVGIHAHRRRRARSIRPRTRLETRRTHHVHGCQRSSLRKRLQSRDGVPGERRHHRRRARTPLGSRT